MANRDFLLNNPEFKLIYQSYTKAHPNNLSKQDLKDAKEGWWNGVNIIYKDTENELDTYFPPTFRDRGLYENEHILLKLWSQPNWIKWLIYFSIAYILFLIKEAFDIVLWLLFCIILYYIIFAKNIFKTRTYYEKNNF